MCWFPKKNFAYKREAGAAGPPATGRRRGSVLNITAAVWTAGFHWWRSGNKKRTQNVSEYMLVLALCLVDLVLDDLSLGIKATLGLKCLVFVYLEHHILSWSSCLI